MLGRNLKAALKAVDPLAPKHAFRVRRFHGPIAFHQYLGTLRVAHITDLHFGRVTSEAVQLEAIRLVNDGKPDLCVITGDFVCYSQLYLDQMRSVLSKLQVPTYAVLGNHDYWSGADEVARVLARTPVQLLRNQHTLFSVRGESLQIAGLDDSYTSHADLDRTLHGLRDDLPTIGLAHVPEDADRLWQRGIKMVYAGHTHAGQITLARLNELAIGRIAGHKYIHGLYGDRKAYGALYVGAGVGAGMMPMRVGDRGKREVAFFELGVDAAEPFQDDHSEQAPVGGRRPSAKAKAKRVAYVEKRDLKRELKNAKTALHAAGGRVSRIPPPPSDE